MLTYNTQQPRLRLPEYGRNIQRMVDRCLQIEDREERNLCARTIVRTMGKLFPALRTPDSEHKLWDHLAIMADFKLDIDYPCEVVNAQSLKEPPQRVPYNQAKMVRRSYGRIVPAMLARIAAMEGGPQKDEAIYLVANHMKKQLLALHPDGVDDQRVFRDLYELSEGAIRLEPDTCRLLDFKVVSPVLSKKRQKKLASML